MQAAMDRLDRLPRRHRVPVALAWLVLLLAALPFTARQTEHLTSGGFTVPGSGSETVDRSLARFDGAQRDSLAVVLAQRSGASAADVRREVDRVDGIAARLPHAELSDRGAAVAKRQAGSASIVVIPLDVAGAQDQ